MRLVSALAMVVALWQAATVAQAIPQRFFIECCCGEHDISKPCHCPDCPSALGQRTEPRTAGDSTLTSMHACRTRQAFVLAQDAKTLPLPSVEGLGRPDAAPTTTLTVVPYRTQHETNVPVPPS